MTLYHCDLRGNIESVLCDGFHEGDVWLSDISLLDDADPPLGDEFAQVVGAAPDDGLDGFEAVGNPSVGGGYREFRIPAAVVNAWPRRLGERRGTDVRTEFGRA